MSIAELGIKVTSKGLVAANSGLERLDANASRAERSNNRLSKSSHRLSRSMASVAAAAGLVIGTLVLSAGRILSQFESGMSKVQAVTRATTEEMERMRDVAKDLGATTEFTAAQAASGLSFLGLAGFSAAESIAAIPDVLNLATAAALDLGVAADIASNIMSAYGISADKAGEVSDILAAAASRANTDVMQLGTAMKFAGPVASALGISMNDAAAAVGILSDAGLQGSMAGTGLRRVMSGLVNPTGDAARALKSLGVQLKDVNPETNSLVDIVDLLAKSGLGASEALTIFGDRGGPAILALTSQSENLRELTAELQNVEGEAKTMADTMRDNVGGDVTQLKSALGGLIIALGEAGLTAVIRGVVQLLTGLVRGLSAIVNVTAMAASGIYKLSKRLLGIGKNQRELKAAVDLVSEAMQIEIDRTRSLNEELKSGISVHRKTAEWKLRVAETSLNAAKAAIIEERAVILGSKAYKKLAEKYESVQSQIRATPTTGFGGLEIEGLNKQLVDIVVKMQGMLKPGEELSDHLGTAGENVNKLQEYLSTATGKMVDFAETTEETTDGFSAMLIKASEFLDKQTETQVKAEDMLRLLREEVAIQSMIKRFGEDSAAVASMRAEQERDIVQAKIDDMAISQKLKNEIMLTWDVAQQLAVENERAADATMNAANAASTFALNLSAAATYAGQVLANLGRAPSAMRDLSNEAAQIAAGQEAIANGADKIGVSVAKYRVQLEQSYGLELLTDQFIRDHLNERINAQVELYEANQKGNKALNDQLGLIGKVGKAAGAAGKKIQTMADKMRGELVRGVDGIVDAFSDFISGGLKDFKSFAKSILGTFKQMLINMIAMAVKNKIMIGLGLGGIGAGSAAGAATGIAGSVLGGVGAFATAGAGGTGLLGGLGAAVGVGGATGGGILGIGASAAAAGGGLMATVGAALPIIGIGLLLFSLFKKKPKYSEKDFLKIQAAIEVTNAELLNTSEAGHKAATALKKLVGGTDNLISLTSSYYDRFFTEEEKRLNKIDSVNKVFKKLKIDLPETSDGFRDLVEAQDLTTKKGRETYAALLQISSAFADLYGGANDVAEAVNQLSGTQGVFATLQDQVFAVAAQNNGYIKQVSTTHDDSEDVKALLNVLITAVRTGNINLSRNTGATVALLERQALEPTP